MVSGLDWLTTRARPVFCWDVREGVAFATLDEAYRLRAVWVKYSRGFRVGGNLLTWRKALGF